MSIRKPTAGAHAAESSPEEIRAEIAEVRAELGDTVEALAAKADVKARARDAADNAKAKVAGSVSSGAETVKAKASGLAERVRSTDVQQLPAKARTAAYRVRGQVKQRPVPFAVAAGLALLAIVAVSRRKNR